MWLIMSLTAGCWYMRSRYKELLHRVIVLVTLHIFTCIWIKVSGEKCKIEWIQIKLFMIQDWGSYNYHRWEKKTKKLRLVHRRVLPVLASSHVHLAHAVKLGTLSKKRERKRSFSALTEVTSILCSYSCFIDKGNFHARD